MTATSHDLTVSSAEPLELLRCMLEEQYAMDTDRLTRLTVHAVLPRRTGADTRALDAQATSVRLRIAETARALQRMSQGRYGTCEGCRKPIPLGRLRAVPHAARCVRCDRGPQAGLHGSIRLTRRPAAAPAAS